MSFQVSLVMQFWRLCFFFFSIQSSLSLNLILNIRAFSSFSEVLKNPYSRPSYQASTQKLFGGKTLLSLLFEAFLKSVRGHKRPKIVQLILDRHALCWILKRNFLWKSIHFCDFFPKINGAKTIAFESFSNLESFIMSEAIFAWNDLGQNPISRQQITISVKNMQALSVGFLLHVKMLNHWLPVEQQVLSHDNS